MNGWEPIDTAPEGEEVVTMLCTELGEPRQQQSLVRKGRLWFFPDMSMYVYYTPTHWRPLGKPDALSNNKWESK